MSIPYKEGKSSFIRIMDQPDYSLEPLMQLMEKNRDLSKGQLISVHSAAKGRAVFAVYGLGFAAIALEIALLYWRAWQLRVPLRLNNAEQFMTRGAIVGWCIPASVGLVSCILALTLPRDQISCCGWAYFSMFFLLPAYRGLRRRRFARVEATWAH